MKDITIGKNQSNQRVDKFLLKYLSNADKSFIYKMLRKKNITLNDKKIQGSEKLNIGDSVKIYFSDDTLEKFCGKKNFLSSVNIENANKEKCKEKKQQKQQAEKLINISDIILYEDENIIILNKPVGILSQRADNKEKSINEYMIDYLISNNRISREDLDGFTPSVCNRLDRNTSGIIIGGKSLIGLQEISRLLKDRSLHKYYLCIVQGVMKEGKTINGYLVKNEETNTVKIYSSNVANSALICTSYEPIINNGKFTLVKVLLVTGKTHQIRAHLASINHPIIGDRKYGNSTVNSYFQKKYNLCNQLLHSYELCFPNLDNQFKNLSGKKIVAGTSKLFQNIINGENLIGNMEQQRT